MVRFGHVVENSNGWESFGKFKQADETIKWRITQGKPIATILRWFIENVNTDTGIPDNKHKGRFCSFPPLPIIKIQPMPASPVS